MSDDGFHEIQLNGKQLIFLCMTAALVLVVAFLSGVLVGRGVRSKADVAAVGDTASSAPAVGEAAPPGTMAGAPQTTPAPPITAIAPPTPADEDLTYNSRLEGKQAPAETVKPQSAPVAAPAAKPPAKGPAASEVGKPPAAVKEAVPAPPRAGSDASKAKADVSVPAEPAGAGYYLKIVAYRDRGQADGLARRLAAKGYGAYVVPASGLYSVRIGKYKSRKEADTARRRLEKEEQLKPLIAH